MDTIAKLRANTTIDGECWMWNGPFSGGMWWKGRKLVRAKYGQFKEGRINVFAHRRAYEIAFGQIPAGAVIMHACDNPGCINPDHLRAGTQAENMRDMAEKKRGAAGSDHPRAKLTDGQIISVIQMAASGTPRATLQRRFKISRSTLARILTGKTYRDEVAEAERRVTVY